MKQLFNGYKTYLLVKYAEKKFIRCLKQGFILIR